MFRSSLTACLALLALASCNERPVYRAMPAVEGVGTVAGRDSGPLPDAPPFTLPEPPSAPANPGGADARECGFEKFKLDRVPPSLLLVLDRSSSMGRAAVGAAAGATLWSETIGALDEVIKGTQANVKWGLKLFPFPDGCAVANGAEVVVGANNYDMVLSRVRTDGFNQNGQGGTPTEAAMRRAIDYLRTLPDTNPKYIVLATDGEPNCPIGSSEMARTASLLSVQAATASGFKTYVIGIAIGPEAIETLNLFAVAGGVPRSGPLQFYPVGNRTDLTQALGEIAGQITSCSFTLSKAPPAPDSVKVTIDGERVPPSASDGWSYSNPQNTGIQLNGGWCERLKTKAGQVDIVLGCPGVVVP
jgi:hypothetical protein